ncbi:MAG: glutaconate CoA-transferase [Chloroflexi bacterium]|nr:glutaconate CoA-transferase [Chloroflexota bacterium]
MDYSPDEIMVVEASRYINDGDTVMVGTGMPMIASLFAQKNHAPHMCYIVETGPVAPEVIPTPISVSDPRVMYRAVRLGSLLDALGGVLQRGLADVAFLGGAQIDQFANVNSTVIGEYEHPRVRFPGSGGANDLASHAPRILIITRHERRRFPERCDYITSPGYIDGPDGRRNAGLPVPYPDIYVITDLTVMAIDKSLGRLRVEKLMPGVTVDQVRENTGFEPLEAAEIVVVAPPTSEELRLLREEVDPGGMYVRGVE